MRWSTISETTIFVYDAMSKLLGEYSTEISSTPAVNYTATDSVGSPRAITDENGNVVSRRDFMPFGEELNAGVGDALRLINTTTAAMMSVSGLPDMKEIRKPDWILPKPDTTTINTADLPPSILYLLPENQQIRKHLIGMSTLLLFFAKNHGETRQFTIRTVAYKIGLIIKFVQR